MSQVASQPPCASPEILPREQWAEGVRRWRDAYDMKPGAPLFRCEFWLMPGTLERWAKEGMPPGVDHAALFNFDEPGVTAFSNLGWCEAPFFPAFEEKLIEDRGETEVVQDYAGRHVLFFKGRRVGFMPEYVDHPVKDMRSWEEKVAWRLDPATPQRIAKAHASAQRVREDARHGKFVTENLIGGYMYLRSLMGPEGALYNFIDQPELIHACMQRWFEVADAAIAIHQQYVNIDEIFLAEDICYKGGPLISPDMMREFLIPYYQQLISNLRSRQLDRSHRLHVQIDTDGDCRPVIDVYREGIGMTSMSPFEAASGCDVLEIREKYPDVVMRGGLDKRVLAQGKRAIDEMVERIIPPMRAHGGYIPCIDHGTPEEVRYENYLHFRKRMVELGG